MFQGQVGCLRYNTVVAVVAVRQICLVEAVLSRDVVMPGISGYDVCRALKADSATADIPVLFVTFCDEVEDEQAGLEMGASDYLTKPVSPAIVRARVKNQLALRIAQRELIAQNEVLQARVAERTHALSEGSAQLERANQRLQLMERVQGDFLRMIDHEFRTPIHGVIGIVNLVFDQVPESADRVELLAHYRLVQERLLQLLHDAKLLHQLHKGDGCFAAETIALDDVLDLVSVCRPGDRSLRIDGRECVKDCGVLANRDLFERSMFSFVRLADCFSCGDGSLRLCCERDGPLVSLSFTLNYLRLGGADVGRFFDIACDVRGYSDAQGLGLASIVAERVVALFGGCVSIAKTGERVGLLKIVLPVVAEKKTAAG